MALQMDPAGLGSWTAHVQEAEQAASEQEGEEDGCTFLHPMGHANTRGPKRAVPCVSAQVARPSQMDPAGRGSRMAHAQEEEEEAEEEDDEEERDGWAPRPMDHANTKRMVRAPSTLWHMWHTDPTIPNA